jgi:hypothetical protein
LGLLTLGLPACDFWIGNRIDTLPNGPAWQVLPLRAFLTRPTIQVEAIQFCRAASCGYDAAVGRFTAEADEADTLRETLTNPERLRGLVREPVRLSGKKGAMPAKPAEISSRPFRAKDWTGVEISIVGARGRAYGVMLEQPSGSRLRVIIVFADDAAVARRLAVAATG